MKVLSGAFLVISTDLVIERLLTQSVNEALKKENFEIQVPPEYVANKIILIRNVDSMVSSVDAEELKGTWKEEMNGSEWRR